MSGVAGLRGTGNWGVDERPKDFRESILFFRPNGTAPIFALTSKAGKKTVSDPEFSWWAEGQNIMRFHTAGALSATDTVVTIDSADPTATTMHVPYGTATHLKPGDILLAEPAADAVSYTQEHLRVESVLSDTQFTISRGAGGTTPATIASGAYLLLIGSAYAEGTAAPKAVTRNPQKFFNFTQIFKDSYELTGTADATEARTGDPWSNDKKRKQFDHARNIEQSIIFGVRSETTGSNGKPLRTFGGLRYFIPAGRQTVYSVATTPDTFMDAVSPTFDFDLGGGDTRTFFAGNTAIMELSKIMRNATNARMELGNVVKIYGLDFREFIMPRGRLLLYSHPLMSQHPIYKKAGFILDFSAIKYVALKGRDTKNYDDVQTKDEDLRRGYIQTECSLMIDGGGLSCGYIGNISAT